jgi:hypothetical protein
MTSFTTVYDRFFGKITDDLYLELTPEDTKRDLQTLLIDSIPNFEFPRVKLDYVIESEGEDDKSYFEEELSLEEINILALLMKNAWLNRQITSIENTRQKYSGTDFKLTSQASHLSKLLNLREETRREEFHMQRLYKRRKIDKDGKVASNWSILREKSALD